MTTSQSKSKGPKKKKSLALLELPNERLKDVADGEERRFLNLLITKGEKEHIQKAVDGGVNRRWFMHDHLGEIYNIVAKNFVTYGTLITHQQYDELLRKNLSSPEKIAKWNEHYIDICSAQTEKDEFPSLLAALKDRYIQRQAYTVNMKYHEQLLNATSDQGQLVQEFISSVSGIDVPGSNTHTDILEYSTALKDAWEEIEERRDHPDNFKGLETGFKGFDDLYVLMRGKYGVLMAPEGGGKTTLMLNIALNMARNGHHVAYVIIENDPKLTTQRTLCMHSGVNFNRILKGGKGEDGLDETTIHLLQKAKEELELKMSSRFHWVRTNQGRPASEIIKQLDRIRSFCDLEAIFVDYIGIVGADIVKEGRPDLELAHTSAQFQTYGNNNNALVITAQQMRSEKVRELQKKFKNSADFRVGTGDVSSTKEIAANCDYLFGILIDQENLNRMYIFNAKARYSASHKRIVLNYERNSGQLSDALGPDDIDQFSDMIENEEIKNSALETADGLGAAIEVMKEMTEDTNDFASWAV
ncbi:MAG: DnaB helicase C-terminal domain-containing protein [Candidatus Cloacimonetes bacterium]|jgi:replicative DNA helicase|nr:DnaB helicase C-terminal domain-containing protein [Candidatus Cloacimonadota bacterium]